MTKASATTSAQPSILLISPDSAIKDRLAASKRVSAEPSLSAVNGHAAKLLARHNVILFDTRGGDPGEREAMMRVLAQREVGKAYFALADENLSIAEARKLRDAGVEDVLPDTLEPAELDHAVHSALARHRTAATSGGTGGVLLAVAQARGGIGATTVAVNLAQKLVGRRGGLRRSKAKRVALVDLDVQFGNAHVLLDLEDKGKLLELLTSGAAPAEEDLSGLMQTHASGVDILCAPGAMVPLDAVSPAVVEQLLTLLRRHYDYVVVDLPRSLVEWISPVLAAADELVMVLDTAVPSVRQAKRLIDIYREERLSLPVRFVVNRETRPLFGSACVREAEKLLETRLVHWLPDAPRETRKAADLGQPVVRLYPKCALSKAYGKMAIATAQSAQAASKE